MVNKNGELEGFSVDVIAKIAEMLSFRYEIYLSPDGLYGGWNGKDRLHWNCWRNHKECK